MFKNNADLSKVRIRLKNIREKATKSVSFNPSDLNVNYPEFYLSATLSSVEDINKRYILKPEYSNDRDVFAFDESTQNFRALEGDLFFYSSSVIKVDKKYLFNLQVLPYFLSSMGKFKKNQDDSIIYSKTTEESRNLVMIESKINLINESIEPNSIVLIDGPLIGGNASSYYIKMDDFLRSQNCIPLYFVKNSNSRLIIDHDRNLQYEFNNDFHWAARYLDVLNRSAFFKYTDKDNPNNSKIFTYMKPLQGFPERMEMHTRTYEKFHDYLPEILNLVAYFFIAQGDFSNPQVRPIAIAEKYARAGLKMLNIPVLLGKMGFHPTVNQVRFG
ncbi:MAG: hypothetical protein ACTSPI_07140 [Candidatus Heimdallarchaeaceae archaeon]